MDLAAALPVVLSAASDALTREASRKFISHGPPPFDCADQLTVHLESLKASNPLNRQDIGPNVCAVVPVGVLVVTIVRCVTTQNGKNAPAADDLTSDSTGLLTDLNDLWTGLVTATLDRSLLNVPCSAVTWLPAVPVGPSGGLAAYQLKMEVQL